MELGELFVEQFDRETSSLAVEALIGDGVEPLACGGVEDVEVGDVEA